MTRKMAMDDMQPEDLMNERMIDRLVDGELDERSRGEVLDALESHPDGWRRCALAFLEHQEFARSIPSWSQADRNATVESAQQPTSSRFNWSGLLALAATAFFAFVIGLRSDGWLKSQESGPTIVQSPEVSPTPQLVSQPGPGSSGITIDDFMSRPTIVPADILQELERAGLSVQTHRGLVPGQRPDGSPVLVPYEELEVVPVSNMTH